MSAVGDTVESATLAVSSALTGYAEMLQSADSARAVLASLGWIDVPTIPSALLSLGQSLSGVAGAVGDLIDAQGNQADGTTDDGPVIQALANLVTQLGLALVDVSALNGSASAELPQDYLDATGIGQNLQQRVCDWFLVDLLRANFPRTTAVLTFLGIVVETDLDADDDAHQPAFTLEQINWSRIGTTLKGPDAIMADVYGWGTPDLDTEKLFDAIVELSIALDAFAKVAYLSPAFLQAIAPGAPIPNDGPDPTLVLPLAAPGDVVLSLAVGPVPQITPTEPRALAFHLIGEGTLDEEIPLADNLTLTVTADADLTVGIGGVLRPQQGFAVVTDPDGQPVAFAGGKVVGRVTRATPDGQAAPTPLLTFPGGAFLDAQQLFVEAGVDATGTSPDPFINAGAVSGRFVIPTGDRDSFTSNITPSSGVEADFDFSIGWSQQRGVFFKGSGGLEAAFPVNKQIGPFNVQLVTIKLAPTDGAVTLDVGVVGSASIGPVTAVIDALALAGELQFQSGNLGPLALSLGIAPPTGYGLSIDAGSVHGGGFVSYDSSTGRYSGALQLSVYDIAINAFGLIDTKAPGVDFSFVIVISAQFTPIQLGFGFTLNGVGGMVGINRAIDTTALANLVRAGQSEDLLFPQNVVADAPTIVRDLTTVFPATQGRYVFGPLGKLGWGTPTLITGEIGVILEYPGPVVVILGEVKCILPKSSAALVKLNLSIDGELDFPNKTFAMDAALHDSVINGFPVSGQMAMRVVWGDQPNFVFSIGGFHPAYTPPPNFPKLQPLALDLGSHGPAKISVSGFFAVTSNTVQVGGTASLHASGAGLSFDASVSVKALFVFQPFSFEADINASVKVSFHGYGPSVQLSGTLDGPSPWHVKGEVCVSVLWWDACLGFDVTFGGDQQVTQPSIDPWAGAASTDSTPAILGLQGALSDPGNWTGALVPGTVSSVTRAQGTDTLIDPVGGLTVRQKTAPVETSNPLTKFGVAQVTTPISFSSVQATLGTSGNTVALTPAEAVSDFFAPAQFFDMDDGKKLSSAAFESYQAGYLFATATGNVHGGTSVTFTPQPQTLVINSNGSDTPITTNLTTSDDVVTAANTRSAVAKGGLTQAGTRRFINRTFTQPFTEQVPTFVIASNATLGSVTGAPPAAVRSATLIALDVFRGQNIEQAAGVEVAASFELPPNG